MNNSDTKKNTMVPKLRFSEFFKHNKNWKKKILKHYLKESRILGSTGNIAKKITVKLWGKGVYEKDEYIQGSPNTQYYIRKSGQFIYSKLDFLNQAFGIIPVHLNGYESTVDLPCFDISNELNNKFLLEYIQQGDFYKKFGEIADGGRVAKRIQVGTFLSFPILLPELKEQQKIGDCLSSVDDLILAQEKKIDLLQKHKNGMLQQFFPSSGEVLPEVRFKEFASDKEWSLTKLCSIGTVFQGNKFPEIYQGRIKGKYPFYKVSDISASFQKGNCVIHSAANYIDDHELKIIRATIVPSGTTIFAKIGEAIRLNRRVITSCESLIDNNTAGVKSINGKSNDMFIFYLLSQINLIEYAGGAIPSVRKTAIEDITISVPPSEKEQQKIADCLSSLDELISLEIKKLELLKIHKKGLVQQLFPSMDEVS